jgi:hypothetical protein
LLPRGVGCRAAVRLRQLILPARCIVVILVAIEIAKREQRIGICRRESQPQFKQPDRLAGSSRSACSCRQAEHSFRLGIG